MYRLIYKLTDGTSYQSPVIVPDNPNHDINHKSIERKLNHWVTKLKKSDSTIEEITIRHN